MTRIGWLTRSRTDVPAGDGWLGPREREALARMSVEKRRADWRLGRHVAKAAVGAWLGLDGSRVEILAASDGAPEAWLDGEPAAVSLSLSHRAGRGLAVVAAPGTALGCDLELVEPRSRAFVADWLAPEEQALVAGAGPQRDLVANLVWTAKEAAAKVRREGLRLDVRDAVVRPQGLDAQGAGWRPLTVAWAGGARRSDGWWQAETGWVMAVAGDPAPPAPQALRVAAP